MNFRLSTFLALILLLTFSNGCAPPANSENSSAANGSLELTDEMIRERINGAFLRKVPEENAAGETINWTFDEDEPKEITVVDKQINGALATVVLDIKTQSSPKSREPRQLAGQIRTEWRLETGWALRQWEIIKAENISMKYKNLPKPPAQNANR